MKTLIDIKLKIARESLTKTDEHGLVVPLSQSDIERECGIHQTAISAMEVGIRAHYQTKCLVYLAQKGINLTALFDNNITAEDYKAICDGKGRKLLEPHKDDRPCEKCAAKDQVISDLREHIVTLKDSVAMLKEKITS